MSEDAVSAEPAYRVVSVIPGEGSIARIVMPNTMPTGDPPPNFANLFSMADVLRAATRSDYGFYVDPGHASITGPGPIIGYTPPSLPPMMREDETPLCFEQTTKGALFCADCLRVITAFAVLRDAHQDKVKSPGTRERCPHCFGPLGLFDHESVLRLIPGTPNTSEGRVQVLERTISRLRDESHDQKRRADRAVSERDQLRIQVGRLRRELEEARSNQRPQEDVDILQVREQMARMREVIRSMGGPTPEGRDLRTGRNVDL